jgi:hypothetical protein
MLYFVLLQGHRKDTMPTNSDSAIRRPVPRTRAILLGLLFLASLAIAVSAVWAAVTIANFEVEAGEEEINAYWETASEIGNLGFYLWRSESHDDGYVKLPLDAPQEQFIPSEDFGMGSFYEFVDVQVTPGILYYSKVQDVPANGTTGDFVGPESAMIEPETPDTATPTPIPGATETPLPEPSVRFWADEPSLDAGECATIQWQTENVQTVFFDGTAVTGQEAHTVCPCETQTYTLSVTYQDDTFEDFTVQLTVSGTCQDPEPSLSVLATPTPIPASATPRPTQVRPTSTVRPRSTPEVTRDPAGSLLPVTSPLDTPDAPADLSDPPDAGPGDGSVAAPDDVDSEHGGLVVEGVTVSRRIPPVLLVVAGLLGMGSLAGGIWLWRRG